MKIEVHIQGGLRKIIDITPGATVGATIGTNVFNADGTLFVPSQSGGTSQLSITSWELILNIPPNVTALANTATTGLYVVTGSGTSATRTIVAGDGVDVSNGNGVVGNPVVSHANTSSVTDISASFTGGTVPDQISLTFDQFGHVLTRNITGRTLDHNDTGALQGGNSTERYHFTAAEHAGLLPWADEDPADYALITQTITNGDATHSPSGDAVFDALATKEPTIASGLASQVWRGDKTWGDTVPGNFGASPPGAWSGPAFLFDGSAGGGFFVQNNSQGRVAVRTAGSQSQFIGMTHGGTIAAPSATGNGVPLFELYGSGFGGTTYGFNGLFSFVTTQAHTESARGTEGKIATTANGSASVTNRWRWGNDGHYTPFADNTYDVGSGSFRCRTIYAGTGAINTSDEREKTIRGPLNINELAAAEELASAGVIYQWNEAIERKGSDARLHFGPTVQSVMSIMQKHGLDPFRYGFVCYDRWDESPEVWNEWPAKDEVIDDAGNLVSPATPAGRELTSEYIPAGDRYSLRPSELQFFIARGQEERIRRLEALLNP